MHIANIKGVIGRSYGLLICGNRIEVSGRKHVMVMISYGMEYLKSRNT